MEMLIFSQKPTNNHDNQCQIKWDCRTLEDFTRSHWKCKSDHVTCRELQKEQREG